MVFVCVVMASRAFPAVCYNIWPYNDDKTTSANGKAGAIDERRVSFLLHTAQHEKCDRFDGDDDDGPSVLWASVICARDTICLLQLRWSFCLFVYDLFSGFLFPFGALGVFV